MNFPHLYTCSVCEAPVDVTPMGEGVEPVISRLCSHDGAVVYANRKVVLRGVGKLNPVTEAGLRIRLTLRQLVSWLTGRSV
mgnify:CR=1 FL=1